MTFFFIFIIGLFLSFDEFNVFFFTSLLILFLCLKWGGWFFSGIFFMDGISFFLIFLSFLIFFFCLLTSFLDKWNSNKFKEFTFYMSGIFGLLYFSFSCASYLFFYISFEFVFLLMFIYVLNWGYSPERVTASFYMIFYTLVVSFPFLVCIVKMGQVESGKFLGFLSKPEIWWAVLVVVFLVKLPVYTVHLWLPKAHVEAPVTGSMVLAGVLLKLGTYGLFRFSTFCNCYLSMKKGYLISVGLLGGLVSCFLCLRQADLKSLVAYSSICHMGFGLAGLYSSSSLGLSGGIFMAIGHGFCSSCLFYILYIMYERFHSRSLLLLKGVNYVYPIMGLTWFIFSVLNMGVPPSFSFFSEILILVGVLGSSMLNVILSGLILLFAGIYGIFFFVISCHSSSNLSGFPLLFSIREFILTFGHGAYMLFFIFLLDYFYF